MNERISDRSRWGLTAPASHRRVLTIHAKAIQTGPLRLDADRVGLDLPQVTRLLDQMLMDRLPWTPARASQHATVRSS